MNKLKLFSGQPINMDLGLLLIRVVIGALMAFIGYEKLIHFNEMANSDFWAKEVSFLGMKGAVPLALTVFAEFFCSVLLIVGLFTRVSSFFLLFCMAYIFLVIFPGSMVSKGEHGVEFNTAFTYFVIYLGLFFTGAGKYSLDAKFLRK
ncbi:DoxX family protein [Flavobacterium sp.]|jgi:putative oxidoreductase|uniref:DoxX family protein n=1 Tax=Flavobacterium sp. TaxID=239 RepID=UPI000ECA085A|nr:DoxX family protein [Flavobacterium sp.]HCQ12317.1 DoxX family protein [Flavobacterium sp.]